MAINQLPEYYYLDAFRRIVCFFAASFFILLSYNSWRDDINFYSQSIVTAGTVEKHGSKKIRPIISFVSRDGQHMRFIGHNAGNLRIGDPVTIRYRTPEPEGARINCFFDGCRINSLSELWGMTALFSFIALTFVFGTISGIKTFPEKSRNTLSPIKALVREVFKIVLLLTLFTLIARILPYPGSLGDSPNLTDEDSPTWFTTASFKAASTLGVRYPEDMVFFFCVGLNLLMAVLIVREIMNLWRHYRS